MEETGASSTRGPGHAKPRARNSINLAAAIRLAAAWVRIEPRAYDTGRRSSPHTERKTNAAATDAERNSRHRRRPEGAAGVNRQNRRSPGVRPAGRYHRLTVHTSNRTAAGRRVLIVRGVRRMILGNRERNQILANCVLTVRYFQIANT